MSKTNEKQGIAFVLSSPSGGGKSSVAKELLSKDKNLILSVSVTSRPPRPNEIEGTHYFFKNNQDFRSMIEKNELLEHTEIYGNFYGTSKKHFLDLVSSGKDVLFDIEWNGAAHLRKILPCKVILIFIMPPDIETLEKRLKNRNQDDELTVDLRLSEAKQEMTYAKYYDYVVVNDDFSKTIKEVQSIIEQTRAS